MHVKRYLLKYSTRISSFLRILSSTSQSFKNVSRIGSGIIIRLVTGKFEVFLCYASVPLVNK